MNPAGWTVLADVATNGLLLAIGWGVRSILTTLKEQRAVQAQHETRITVLERVQGISSTSTARQEG